MENLMGGGCWFAGPWPIREIAGRAVKKRGCAFKKYPPPQNKKIPLVQKNKGWLIKLGIIFYLSRLLPPCMADILDPWLVSVVIEVSTKG